MRHLLAWIVLLAVLLASDLASGHGPTEQVRFRAASGPVASYLLQLDPGTGAPWWGSVIRADHQDGWQHVEVPCIQGARLRAVPLDADGNQGEHPSDWSEPFTTCWNPDSDGDGCYGAPDFARFRRTFLECWTDGGQHPEHH